MEKVPTLDIFTKPTRPNSQSKFNMSKEFNETLESKMNSTFSSLNRSISASKIRQGSNYYKQALKIMNGSSQFSSQLHNSSLKYSNDSSGVTQLRRFNKNNICERNNSSNIVIQNNNSRINVQETHNHRTAPIVVRQVKNLSPNKVSFQYNNQINISPIINHPNISSNPQRIQNYSSNVHVLRQHPQNVPVAHIQTQPIHHQFHNKIHQNQQLIYPNSQFISIKPSQIRNQTKVQRKISQSNLNRSQNNQNRPVMANINNQNCPAQPQQQFQRQPIFQNMSTALTNKNSQANKQYLSLITQNRMEQQESKPKKYLENEQELPNFNYTHDKNKEYTFCQQSFKKSRQSLQSTQKLKSYVFDQTYLLQIKQIQNRLPSLFEIDNLQEIEQANKIENLFRDLTQAKEESIKEGNKYIQSLDMIINTYKPEQKETEQNDLFKSVRRSIFSLIS